VNTPRALLAAVVTILAVLPAAAAAQAAPPPDHRYEVTLLVGASLLDTGSDEIRAFPVDAILPFESFLPPGLRGLLPTRFEQRSGMGGSLLLGFEASRRIGGRAWIETSFLIAPGHTLREDASFDCPAEVCALAGFASFSDLLGAEERVVAYHYGLGFAYEPTRGQVRPFLSVGAGAVTFDVAGRSETRFAFDVGGGARLGFSDRVGARLEVADRIVPDHFLGGGTEHDLQVRAGLTFRLP
jgi:opacity protein-like surface antigen